MFLSQAAWKFISLTGITSMDNKMEETYQVIHVQMMSSECITYCVAIALSMM